MKAMVIEAYGGPEEFRLVHLPTPTPPPRGAVVRVRAASVNAGDLKRRQGELKLVSSALRPAILGYDVAGEIHALAPDAQGWKVGDAVYGMRSVPRGGTYAEFVALEEGCFAPKPPSLSFAEAAAIPLAGQTALQALVRRAALRKGSKVLLLGAAGGVGSFALQIASAQGAEVDALASPVHEALLRRLGATRVLASTDFDLAKLEARYDIIADFVGSFDPWACRSRMTPRGVFVTTVPSARRFLLSFASKVGIGRRTELFLVKASRSDLDALGALVEAKKLKPVVREVLPFDEVAEAHRRMSGRGNYGKIVLEGWR